MNAISAAIIVLAGAIVFLKEPVIGSGVGLVGLLAWGICLVTTPAIKD